MTFQRTQLLNFPVSAGPCLSLLYTHPRKVCSWHIFSALPVMIDPLPTELNFQWERCFFMKLINFILFHIFCKKCIAAIACAEIPNRQWLEVVDILQNIAVQPTSADSLREQALEAIGYLCQDIVSTLFINCQPFKPSLLQMQVPFQRNWLIEYYRKGVMLKFLGRPLIRILLYVALYQWLIITKNFSCILKLMLSLSHYCLKKTDTDTFYTL